MDPGPGYKDCVNCPLRREYDTVEERAAFCAESCPYDVDENGAKMPAGPSVRFVAAQIWSRLPDSVLSANAEEMGIRFLMDVEALKEERGARLFG